MGPSGEEATSDSIVTIATGLSANKAQQCHETGTEVIGVTRRVVPGKKGPRSAFCQPRNLQKSKTQCAAPGWSGDRPAGGTTTVDRLPSAVSF